MYYIAEVQQKGSSVYAYSAGGSMLWARNGILLNWTSHEVAIKEGGRVHIYDYYGREIS